MSVVFVNRYFHPDHSATAQLLTDLTFDLADAGERVAVVTSGQLIDDPRAKLPPFERVRGVAVHRVPGTRFGRGGLAGRAIDYATFYRGAGRVLPTLCAAGDVLVAKTDPPLISVVAARVAAARGARLVNWLHDLFPEVATALGVRGLGGPAGAFLRRARNRSLAAAGANVVIGERMAERLIAEGVPGSTIRLIPNWSDGRVVTPIPAGDSRMRAAHDLGRDRLVVGYAGNFGRAHEFTTLLDAAGMLRQADAPVRFLLSGNGAQRPRLETEVAARGLDAVHFADYVTRDRLADSLAASDVHLVTLNPAVEGLVVPSKIYGILAAGRAAVFVGAPDGEVARLLARHRCGLTVPPGDAQGLADALRALALDPDRVAAWGRTARAAFDREHDRTIAVSKWRDLLAQ